MLHTFRALGQNMALDVESGAIHVLDKLAYDVLSRPHLSKADLIQTLSGEYAPEEIQQVFEEVDQLKASGALDAPPVPVVMNAQEPVIKAMCLHAAHDCNLRCKYCFASTGDFCGERGLLSYETGKAALDFLLEHSGSRKILEVDFFGGEPLMNFPVVKELVAYGRGLEKQHNKEFKFTMTTNGIGLTDDIIQFLVDEMDNVVISIDGRKEIHDWMRPTVNGKGSYDLILANAKKLVKERQGQRYYVRGTFTRRNMDFAQDVCTLADEGFDQISVEPVVLDADSPFSLLPEHLPAILEEYDKLAQAYIQRRAQGQWFNFFHFMVDLGNGPCLRKRLAGCGAGNEYIAVTPDGEIYPCHQFVGREGYCMGSVLDKRFDKEMQKTFGANHVLNKPTCQSCWAKYHCSGGCAANAQRFSGDISVPYDMECQMQRKRLECALAIYAIENHSQEELEKSDEEAMG